MKNKLILAVILVVVAAVGIYLIASKEKTEIPPQKIVMNVGYIDLPTPLFIAKEKEYFDEVGIDVQLQKFSNSNLMIEALERGEIDATSPIGYSTLFAFDNRKSGVFKIYGGYSENENTSWSAVVVKSGGNIDSPEKLKGQKIVIASGKSPKSQAELVIKGIGLQSSDVEFIAVGRNLILPTFSNADVNAFIGTEPTIALLLEKGGGKILITSPRVKFIQNPYPTAGAVLGQEFIQSNQETTKKFVEAVNSGVTFIKTNEQESKKIFAKYLELEEAIANRMGLPNFETAQQVDRAAVEKLADEEVAKKILDKKPNIQNFFLEN